MKKYKKDSRLTLLLSILGLVVIVGGVYFNVRQNVSTQISGAPTATIDSQSLATTSTNPTLTGNATGVARLAIFVYIDDPTHQNDYGVYGPYPSLVDVHNGRWSYHLGTSDWSGATHLSPGSYTVDVRQYTGVTPPGGEGLASLLTGEDLTTGTLVVGSKTANTTVGSSQSKGGFESIQAIENDKNASTLSAEYGEDATGIFLTMNHSNIKADPSTFLVSRDWPIYAEDKKYVYVDGVVIPGADLQTFVPLCGVPINYEIFCAYGKDAQHVYAYAQILPGADPKTFVSLISNNATNEDSAGKSWTTSAIDASAFYSGYVPLDPNDPTSTLQGIRISTLSDGTPIHFSDTSKVIAINLDDSRWGGYYDGVKIGSKSYYGGTYLVDGTSVYTEYSACDVDASGKESNCTELLSRVDKVGDKPAGL